MAVGPPGLQEGLGPRQTGFAGFHAPSVPLAGGPGGW